MKQVRLFFSRLGADTPVIWGCIVAAVLLPFLLSVGPANAQSGNLYGTFSAQRIQSVTPGVVVAMREVLVEAKTVDRVFGGTTGGLLGSAAMRHIARNSQGSDRAALTMLGAALGAYGGNAIAERVAVTQALELIVETQDGRGRVRHIAVVQPAPAPVVGVGSPVFVLSEGGRYRVIPNHSMVVNLPAPAGCNCNEDGTSFQN